MTDSEELTKSLMEMLQQVWRDKGLPEGLINPAVTKAFAQKLMQGVEDGYGVTFSSLDFDTPDYAMLEALQSNVWQFSAAKNYTQLRELSAALVGEDGKLRTWQQFKEAAMAINSKHIETYLNAEYNLAVAGGQMASKWLDIEANAEALPLLEFDAVLDGQTTALCRGLNGTLLPINHPFWSIYYPPNHFRCRSTVRQRATGQITAATDIPSADIPDMFKTNLAKDRLVFPKGHPYFEGLPDTVLKKGKELQDGK